MAAAAAELPLLATFVDQPTSALQDLANNPTSDSVQSFLAALVPKAKELEKLKADILRHDIELENAVRSSETRVRAQKQDAEKALQEVETLRKDLNSRETAVANLESEVRSAKDAVITSQSEVETLSKQIKNFEKSNRESLALLDTKTKAHDQLASDVQAQHQKISGLKRELSAAQEQIHNKDNELSNARFRDSSHQSEIGLLKRSNEWLETELKTKSDEYSKYRKDKGARIAELQRTNEDATSRIEAFQRTESGLRRRVEELSQKADDAFSKIQQLQEEAARNQESFRAELENAHRLADLQKQSADTAKRRVQELDNFLEQTKEEAGEEIGQIQAELETERGARETAEQRIEEVETECERLRDHGKLHATSSSRPQTPQRNINGLGGFATPGRAGSPAPGSATPGSLRGRGGLSFTQMYNEYNNMKAELASERDRNEKMTSSMDAMIHDLEKKEPMLQELQVEHERLEAEVDHLSAVASSANSDKDTAKRESRKWQSQAEGLAREADLQRQQLRDLSSQIKVLLIEVQIRTEGVQLTPAERQELEQSARLDVADLQGMSDTGKFISEKLAIFKNVFELQEQNNKLLNLTRQLGERMEGDEAREKQHQQERDQEELAKLRERCEGYKDEIKSVITQSQAFARERDMFRRMLSQGGRNTAHADLNQLFDSSTNGGMPATPRGAAASPDVAQTPHTKELADYAKLLKEMQSHFDAYKQEAATDHSTLRTQVTSLAKEKGELQGEIARVSSQMSLAQERYDMLQQSYNHLRTESDDHQRQSHALADSAAKQDIKTQQVAEELVEAKGLADSMRNENANLKAEKDLWRRVEARLNDDNRSLVEERGRLNKTISDTQTLYNERETADSEMRRKLQTQIENLESELRSVNRKLEDAAEENKNSTIRREYDQEQSRSRIDELVKSLSNAKEELVAAKTTRDQLQNRVEELKIDLRTAQQHAQVLQARPTPRSVTQADTPSATVAPSETNLSREQELEIQIADLKRDLDLAKGEVESAKAQVEQYKAISQSCEEEIESINETFDQYRDDNDKITAEKDARIRDLERRAEEISNELSVTNTQLSELQSASEDSQSRLQQQKEIFDGEISRIKDECERYQETANYHKEDLKAQAEIAQTAQQSYETELLKHAEAAKTLQKVREEYNEVKLRVSQSEAEAKAAKASLEQSEDSWQSTRDQYEQEIEELKKRRNDVDNQNKLLHQQMENVSAQVASLQKNRLSNVADMDNSTSTEGGLENLQEIIRYLRSEKSIVDMQYELSVQEAKRLKQQLDHTHNQLEETRLKLDQERRRQADQDRAANSHSKLMETINELNVFRASSVTLRNEARQAQEKLAEKSAHVDRLIAEMQPLQLAKRTLENEKETAQGELKLLQEDRDRWQKRTQDILQKYDRIDPAELEALKTRITELDGEKQEVVSARDSLQQQVDTIPEQVDKANKEGAETMKTRLSEQFKTRSKELSARIKNAENTAKEMTDQKEEIQKELDTVKAARDEALARVQELMTARSSPVNQEPQQQDTMMANTTEEGEVAEESASQTEDLKAAQSQVEQLTVRVSQLESELAFATAQKDQIINELQQKLKDSENQLQEIGERHLAPSSELQEQVQKLTTELTDAQKRIAELQTASPATASDAATADSNTQVSTSITEANTELESRIAAIKQELENEHKEKTTSLEGDFQRRSDGMRAQLNQKLSESKGKIRDELKAEHDAELEKLRSDHETANVTLRSEHEKAMQELRDAHTQVVEDMKKAIENNAPKPTESASGEQPNASDNQATGLPELSDDQVKHLVASNETLRRIINNSLKKRIDQKEIELKEAMSTELGEAKAKADKAKENAVKIEGKKWTVKMNMTENRLRTASGKMQMVEKAASDTPQKAVAEVWETVKDYKAPPVPPEGVTASPAPVSDTPTQPPTSPTAGKETGSTSIPTQSTDQPNMSDPSSQQGLSGTPNQSQDERPQEAATAAASAPPTSVNSQHPIPSSIPRGGSAIPRGGSSIPRGAGGAGAAPGGTRRLSNAGPLSEGAQRGRRTSFNRGGGVAGAGRGQQQANQQQQGPGLQGFNVMGRGQGNLNAQAHQFQPNQNNQNNHKRAREDSAGPGDRGGKRQRGDRH